jgi:transposase InsO family protein
MNIHSNARLTVFGREEIIRKHKAGDSPRAIATASGVSPATVYKWIRRYKTEGPDGLKDRSSRPRRLRRPTPQDQIELVEDMRRARKPMWKISAALGLSRSTVARICKHAGLSRLKALDPKPAIVRYEKDAPGDMIHIDTKKLGRIDGIGHRITGDRKGQSSKRGTGWEVLHLAVDDHSRLAYSEVLPDETRLSCLIFLRNALRFFRRHGVTIRCVMTDNGPAFKSHKYRQCLKRLNIKHKRTKAYRPQTNGKVERFVQTSLREWAYERPYETSKARANNLLPFLHHYNYHRPHWGIKGKTPASRLVPVNNLFEHNI